MPGRLQSLFVRYAKTNVEDQECPPDAAAGEKFDQPADQLHTNQPPDKTVVDFSRCEWRWPGRALNAVRKLGVFHHDPITHPSPDLGFQMNSARGYKRFHLVERERPLPGTIKRVVPRCIRHP
ncbi:hypothetical protein D3C76_1448130 [compost metagenome]